MSQEETLGSVTQDLGNSTQQQSQTFLTSFIIMTSKSPRQQSCLPLTQSVTNLARAGALDQLISELKQTQSPTTTPTNLQSPATPKQHPQFLPLPHPKVLELKSADDCPKNNIDHQMFPKNASLRSRSPTQSTVGSPKPVQEMGCTNPSLDIPTKDEKYRQTRNIQQDLGAIPKSPRPMHLDLQSSIASLDSLEMRPLHTSTPVEKGANTENFPSISSRSPPHQSWKIRSRDCSLRASQRTNTSRGSSTHRQWSISMLSNEDQKHLQSEKTKTTQGPTPKPNIFNDDIVIPAFSSNTATGNCLAIRQRAPGPLRTSTQSGQMAVHGHTSNVTNNRKGDYGQLVHNSNSGHHQNNSDTQSAIKLANTIEDIEKSNNTHVPENPPQNSGKQLTHMIAQEETNSRYHQEAKTICQKTKNSYIA